jgi:hypothetical protein
MFIFAGRCMIHTHWLVCFRLSHLTTLCQLNTLYSVKCGIFTYKRNSNLEYFSVIIVLKSIGRYLYGNNQYNKLSSLRYKQSVSSPIWNKGSTCYLLNIRVIGIYVCLLLRSACMYVWMYVLLFFVCNLYHSIILAFAWRAWVKPRKIN